ncbi:MAG: methyltransferase domain-containing protein [Pseudorhodoplanes sp.]|jgi:SAM-dependent methyltransferase|nr:methyltransferase domain-containing protein [Pseudorhodoplanes sp.]
MTEDISLSEFRSMDEVKALQTYIDALTAFDAIEQLQELKRIERATVTPQSSVLDVGCGFGLETERLARLAPGQPAAGIDESAHFIEVAKRRAVAAGLKIDYRAGVAEKLPYADASFVHVRAERLLIYLTDVRRALSEMKRVLKPGGVIALIEPDFGTTTVNVSDRALVRRVMAHEADTAVKQSWLPGQLAGMLTGLGLRDIAVHTRVVIFPQDLGAEYFSSTAENAQKDGAISQAERAAWDAEIAQLQKSGALFGTVDYFLFTARE